MSPGSLQTRLRGPTTPQPPSTQPLPGFHVSSVTIQQTVHRSKAYTVPQSVFDIRPSQQDISRAHTNL